MFRGPDFIGDFAVADFDGDQKADIVVSDISSNSLRFLRSNGDGTFEAPELPRPRVAPGPADVYAAVAEARTRFDA